MDRAPGAVRPALTRRRPVVPFGGAGSRTGTATVTGFVVALRNDLAAALARLDGPGQDRLRTGQLIDGWRSGSPWWVPQHDSVSDDTAEGLGRSCEVAHFGPEVP